MNISLNDSLLDHLNILRVISKIKETQKINTTGTRIEIVNDNTTTWLKRKISGETKHENIRTLKDIYRQFNQLINIVIGKDSHDLCESDELVELLINAALDVRDSITGLDNLAKTYIIFPATVVELNGIARDYALPAYNKILSNIPDEKWRTEFDEDIIFQGNIIKNGSVRSK